MQTSRSIVQCVDRSGQKGIICLGTYWIPTSTTKNVFIVIEGKKQQKLISLCLLYLQFGEEGEISEEGE